MGYSNKTATTRLVLVLSTGPQHDRVNVGMGAPALVTAGGGASTLVLDTFARGAEAFFEPPASGGATASLRSA